MRVLITGPPAAGKTTLARQLADIHDATVIDFDQVAAELGSSDPFDHPDDIRRATHAEIDRRLDALDGAAIVIRSAPTRSDRAALAQRIQADRVVVLNVPAAEAKRRAAADQRPDWTAAAIDRWWQRYEPDEHPDPATGSPSTETGEPAMPDAPTGPATGTEGQPPVEPPETPAATEPPAEPEPKPTETVDFWKQKARDQEKRAKANAGAAKELDELKASMMSETEKAVAEAEARGRKAATTDAGQRLAAAEIKAALTGIVPDPSAIAEDLNLAKYVTDDGDVDLDAVGALKAKYEALKPAQGGTPSVPGQRPTENLPTVPLPNSGQIQLDEETDPRKLAARIRRM